MPIGSGFVNLSNILALNRKKGEEMGDQLEGNATSGLVKRQNGTQGLQLPGVGSTMAGNRSPNQPNMGFSVTNQGEADAAKAAQLKTGLLRSNGGVQAALQDQYGKGEAGYNTGQSGFDAAVAGVQGKAQNDFNNIGSALAGYKPGSPGAQVQAQKQAVKASVTDSAVQRGIQGAQQHGKIPADSANRDVVQANEDGTYQEWVKAGRPPYAQWKAQKDGGSF